LWNVRTHTVTIRTDGSMKNIPNDATKHRRNKSRERCAIDSMKNIPNDATKHRRNKSKEGCANRKNTE
jgi:hypothetical protein